MTKAAENRGHRESPPALQREAQHSGLSSAFTSEEFNLRAALGGPRGILESVVPTLLFVILYLLTRDVVLSSVASLAACLVAIILRLVHHQNVVPAVSGAAGVALGAFVAVRSGDGTGYYLPGIITNAVYGLALVLCVALRKPVVGYLAAMLDERVKSWKSHPRAVSLYNRATVTYAVLFLTKVLVQAPLALGGFTDTLGIVKLAMGLPLFAVVTYVIYLMHKSAVQSIQHAQEISCSQ